MFDKIIVPLDGSEPSEQVVVYASALGRAMQVPLRLLYVVDPSVQDGHHEGAHPVFVEQFVERQRGWARVYLQHLAQTLEVEGNRTEVEVCLGSPAEEIVQEAGPEGRHLVAMATHGRSGIGRLVLGSVTDLVLQSGTTPLLLYKPRKGLPLRVAAVHTIIVPLDGSPLAESVLPLAQYLARATRARLLLARVVPVYSFALAGSMDGEPDGLFGEKDGETRAYLAAHAANLSAAGFEVSSLTLVGDPASELAALPSSAPDSLIVMSTHRRSGMGRIVLGSVADELVRRSGAPVLIYRGPAQ